MVTVTELKDLINRKLRESNQKCLLQLTVFIVKQKMTFLKTQICFNLCLLIIFLNYHVGEQ